MIIPINTYVPNSSMAKPVVEVLLLDTTNIVSQLSAFLSIL